MFKIIAVSLGLLLAVPAVAQASPPTAADIKAIDAKVDTFFGNINAGHVDTAFTETFVPRMSTDNKSQLQVLISQTQTAVNYAGIPLKWEMISENDMASVLVERTYVVYSKDLPAKFQFIFFKTPNGWYLQSIYFGDFNPQNN